MAWIESTLHKQFEIIIGNNDNFHERIMFKMLRFRSLGSNWWWIRSCSMREMPEIESYSPHLIFDHHYLPAWCGLGFCFQYSCTAWTSESVPIRKNGACSTPLLSNPVSSMWLWWSRYFMSQADSLAGHYEMTVSFYNIISTNHLFMSIISIV